ncbi:OLC1v1028085C1 [Oldenlandia corymbosa var. corymbosa]|uniref:non-specific serine/threonine protein kinase n=1 Tax=Oldenlandia corymbosa var. corymbosa TaxID=529605 RepID=A0AAV1CAY6_OLDCO|nr:OLC1v1028085C1 [Oldenlandia corymbosa var. corymbosa]
MNFDRFVVTFFVPIICLAPSVKPQTCQKNCGSVPVKYPFGTGPGCGDIRFQSYVTCNNQQQLTFSTHSGCYPITSIDYNKQIMFISDPSMSTCFCSQPSKGFSLDWNAPFSFHDDTVFALLDCSSSSSPIYKSMVDANVSNHFPLCDAQGADVCKTLYSCQAISSRVNVVPGSSCCVYTPVDLGPSFEMDLEKLQCSSYSGLYGFNGQEFNPGAWSYGVAIKYKFSFDNDYPEMCAHCEKSNGICGYSGPYNSYVCYCPNGVNTSSDCFFGSAWSISSRIFPRQTGMMFIYGTAWLFILLAIV